MFSFLIILKPFFRHSQPSGAMTHTALPYIQGENTTRLNPFLCAAHYHFPKLILVLSSHDRYVLSIWKLSFITATFARGSLLFPFITFIILRGSIILLLPLEGSEAWQQLPEKG